MDSPPPSHPQDDRIYCLWCDYNLTGVASQKCPECGEPFDADELHGNMHGRPTPIPIWDTHEAPAARFFNTASAILFSPTQFARGIPPQPLHGSSISFATACHGLCALMLAVVIAATDPDMVLAAGIVVSGGYVIIRSVEVALAAALQVVNLKNANISLEKRSRFFASIVHFNAVFLIISTVLWITQLLLESVGDLISAASTLGLLGNALWWWITLIRMLGVRCELDVRFVAAVVLVPIVTAVSTLFSLYIVIIALGVVCRF